GGAVGRTRPPLPHRAAGGVRRAAPGFGRRQGGLRRDQLRAARRRRGPALALPGHRAPRHPAAVPGLLRAPRRARPVRPGGAPRAGRNPAAAFPLTATTGRVLAQYQSGAQTRRVEELNEAAPEVFVEVHPDTAERAGLADGALARVTSPRGSALARVRVVATMRTDTVFLPFHFPGEGRANLLTGGALDPRSRMPEFKVSAVRIEPAQEEVAR